MIPSVIALFLAIAILASPKAGTIFGTTLAGSGPGSLRQAIADAPANGTIRFRVEGDIVLTSGELPIEKPLRILSGRRQHITISVASNLSNSRVFTVTGAPVLMTDLTIHDGDNSLFDDAVDLTTAPARDQRGVNRPQGPALDIGSVEVEES
jgi:hypothetical protein